MKTKAPGLPGQELPKKVFQGEGHNFSPGRAPSATLKRRTSLLQELENQHTAYRHSASTELARVGSTTTQTPTVQREPAPAEPSSTSLSARDDDLSALAAARHLWDAMARRVAGRFWMRLYVESSTPGKKGKYDDSGRLTPRNLPDRPAAVMICDNRGRTRVLVFDFDTSLSKHAGEQAAAEVHRDATQLISWVRQLGGVVVVDRSTSGGIHVLVPLAQHELVPCHALQPMYQQLAKLLPTLDISPTTNAKEGCITPPGARCRTGGFRALLDMTVDEAIAAFNTRSAPRLAAHLRGIANEQLRIRNQLGEYDNDTEAPAATTAYEAGPGPDERLPANLTVTAQLRPWVPAFLAHGTVPAHTDRLGKPWTASHARLSVLHHHAARGYSLNDIRATRHDPDWAGFWTGYNDRKDHVKRLSIDWSRAYSEARKRLTTMSPKSSDPAHKPVQPHTGGDGGIRDIRWRLAAARRWILLSGEFQGQQQWTALAVVTALAVAIGMTREKTAAMGVRWIAVAAGLCGHEATHSVLRKLRSIDGSPVKFVEPWDARQHSGDRYTLVEPRLDGEIIRPAEWEAYATRVEPIDPVWAELGLAAWWIHTILQGIEPGPGETVSPTELAAAARVSLSTVHRATRHLQEHGIVDLGHGWIARTGRSPRRIPLLSAQADERRATRIEANRRAQTEFWAFWDVITTAYSEREIVSYSSLAELERDTPAYNAAVCPTAVPRTGGPPEPEPPPNSDDEDDAALALLQDALGAIILDGELAMT